MFLVKDTKARFGLVSVLLHWYIAAVILFLLPTGLIIDYLGPHGPLRPLREDIIWWHMSIAVNSIPFFLFRIFWRGRYGKPKTHIQHWSLKLLADAVWRALLAANVWQILTGPTLQLSHQYDVHWFGFELIPVQPFITDRMTGFLHNAHIYGAYTIGVLLVLHVGGALKHQFVNRDDVLRRILWPVQSHVADTTNGARGRAVTPLSASAIDRSGARARVV